MNSHGKEKIKIQEHYYVIRQTKHQQTSILCNVFSLLKTLLLRKCENGTICIFVKKVGGWKGQAMATSTTRMLSSSWLNFRWSLVRWFHHTMPFVFGFSLFPISQISIVCTDVNNFYMRQLQMFQKVEYGGFSKWF